MEFNPHLYQRFAIDWIMNHKSCGLFLEMGLGKTVVTLTAINRLIYQDFEVGKVLVVAPKFVAATVWQEEAQKWDHLGHLTFSKILGPQDKRLEALRRPADVYIINRENVPWLVQEIQQRPPKERQWPFDMVVLDELSSFKSASAARFKALRRVRPAINRIVGLTGTPSPNGYLDLWPQIYLLDRGERLGSTLTGYRSRYFTPGRRNGNIVYEWRIQPGAAEQIERRISDMCFSLRSEGLVSLPGKRVVDVLVDMEKPSEGLYKALERNLTAEIKPDEEITATSAAVLAGKLLQLANGAVYKEGVTEQTGGTSCPDYTEIHSAKLDALESLIEAASGEPVLVYYQFKHDADRIMKRLPQAVKLEGAEQIAAFNAGQIPVLLAHPASAGHGVNLQQGGHIMIWFGLPWSLEQYQQANARLYRQGQKKPVAIYHILTRGTIDLRVLSVLEGKGKTQAQLMEAVRAHLEGVTKNDG